MMQLIVDIGNTDIVFGGFQEDQWVRSWRHPSDQLDSLETWWEETVLPESPATWDRVVLSSVVPEATEEVYRFLLTKTALTPIRIGPSLFRRLEMEILKPDEIGADLVANAYASWHRFGTACIAVDFGTALTFTVVSAAGNIEGVAFAPGLKTAIHALFLQAAQLPEVPLVLPETAIGKNTIHALQSGTMLGYIGLVKEMLARIQEELGGTCKCIATGGLSGVLSPLHAYFDQVDKTLTLDGLRLLGEFAVRHPE
ncbi:MAG: type III pantothenate kinase [Bacteroidota bacterium]